MGVAAVAAARGLVLPEGEVVVMGRGGGQRGGLGEVVEGGLWWLGCLEFLLFWYGIGSLRFDRR